MRIGQLTLRENKGSSRTILVGWWGKFRPGGYYAIPKLEQNKVEEI
jgi:hypothetical protein